SRAVRDVGRNLLRPSVHARLLHLHPKARSREDARAERLRSLGAETVTGDLLDLDQVRAAMEVVDGAYFVYPFRDGLIEAAAFFAPAGGWKRGIHCMNDPQPEGHMASHIRRREFLATLLGGAAARPFAVGAQQDERVRRIRRAHGHSHK